MRTCSKARCYKGSEDRRKWVLQSTSTSSWSILLFWYHGNLALNHQRYFPWQVSNCAQCFILEYCYCESVVYFLNLLSLLFFLLQYSLIHMVSSDDPRCWKGTWDCCCSCHCHLSLPTMSRPCRECSLTLYINGDRQRWPSTFGAS